VDELSADFHRHIAKTRERLMMGGDASANSISRFHDRDANSRCRQRAAGGKACGTRANDQDVVAVVVWRRNDQERPCGAGAINCSSALGSMGLVKW
jgi:hypothetical protein